MRTTEDERKAPRWDDEPRSGEFGPQGAALILELQRLRKAIDAEKNETRAKRPKPRAKAKPEPRRHLVPKRKRKNRVRKAIAVCLQQFGLTSPPDVEPRHEPAPTPAPLRRSPTLAPRDPLTMDLSGLASDLQKHMVVNPAAEID